ncbi:fibronectin type III domain-containing protein [Flavivirga rizhaonensis]|uniref:Fibronectin type-III domain-containing protein n=1 Tax=Flavivirga rizhaonensis TaxID=2559571 RepID=A0A4S1DU86_9FLAO|nr:SusE domain-containing protein [Flavivirga rizhaonensis]TGV00972.1 hypothetical protein EM932_17455 [Flavivirga rizhaonensis]
MKITINNTVLTIILSTLMFSCGGGSDDSTEDPGNNTPPTIPSLSEPVNNLLCTDNNLTFKWNASSDPDGDPISYTLEVATDNGFTQIVHSFNNLSSTSKSILLDEGLAHYWRVKAKDNNGDSSSYSNTFQLYTEGEGEINYLPFSPVLVGPDIDATLSDLNTSLSWTGSHITTGAVLTYDVYLDTSNPPTTEVANSISETTYSTTLNASTVYYWKVVVKDDNGGVTHGQVWSFKTN